MSIGWSRNRARMRVGALALLLIPLCGFDASAAGLFESLFGGYRSPTTFAPPQPIAPPLYYAAPTPSGLSVAMQPSAMDVGRSVSFCVRLCDGRYFPVQRHAKATPVQACAALCPAAKTKVFFGSEIAHARASNGTRYNDLDNAYVYRKKIVSDCSCNGRSAFGLAPIDLMKDTTLRPGDMIATETGTISFTGSAMQLRKSIGMAPTSTRLN